MILIKCTRATCLLTHIYLTSNMATRKKNRQLFPNSIFDKTSLLEFFVENNIKEIHAKKICRLMMKDPSLSFSDIPGLPKKAAILLSANFVPLTSTLISASTSSDKKTTKLLIELQDGNQIETVIIRHSDTRSGGHNVVCVSSQIGCKMGCTFCATGTLGLIGNLKCAEILEQIVHAKLTVESGSIIRNIVFMGMGEPLDNYAEVKQAIHGMHDRSQFNLAWNHITLSTVGVVPKMQLFTQDFPKANLALSLHAPSQAVRKQIVPTSSAFTIKKIMNAVVHHITTTNNKIFIEYIMIGNVNAYKIHAEELGQLFVDNDITHKICINLIPYNPTDIGDEHEFEAPTDVQLEEFKTVIMGKGIFCTIRKSTTSGRDVDGACGQLALKGNRDIEDLIKRNTNKKMKRKLRKKNKNKKKMNVQQNTLKHHKSIPWKQLWNTVNTRTLLLGTAVVFTVGIAVGLVYQSSNRTERKKGK
eukprot:296518_1